MRFNKVVGSDILKGPAKFLQDYCNMVVQRTRMGVDEAAPAGKPEPMHQYRRLSLGLALSLTLDNLTAAGQISNEIASKTLVQYDVHMSGQLAKATPRVRFASKDVANFREHNNVYECLIKNTNIRITGLNSSIDTTVITTVDEILLEMHPSAGIKKRVPSSFLTRPVQ
ncbi:uncharacterized protein LOC110844485 isoform X1 [Folsomia candida]|uniref:uncharacterized protein LOC110844485 isoform X1 n=1 Tax=Folsomia candida TaxID=158441 RepID=UPI001605157C|nr:uncharacterized protein LOC110844485 isoform X1 [Folsomia candida]